MSKQMDDGVSIKEYGFDRKWRKWEDIVDPKKRSVYQTE